MKSRVVPVTFLMIATLIGAGCAKTSNTNVPNAKSSNEPLVWLPTSTPSSEKSPTALEELRNAISAFQTVKSFKSTLYADNANGKTTAQINILKPSRFHGTIHLTSTNNDAEIIGVDQTLYIKSMGGPWVEIASPSMSKQLAATFQSAADGSGTLINASLPDGTIVTKKYDKLHSCDAYTTKLSPKNGDSVDLTVCVARGLPASLDIKTRDSHVTVSYTDYNSLFVIERPTVGK